jgi:hypothetical protein
LAYVTAWGVRIGGMSRPARKSCMIWPHRFVN